LPQKIPFALPDNSSGEWNSIFYSFRERGQPRELYLKFPKFPAGIVREFLLNGKRPVDTILISMSFKIADEGVHHGGEISKLQNKKNNN